MMKKTRMLLVLALVLVGMLSSCGLAVPRPEVKAGDRGSPEPSLYISYPENEYGEIRVMNDPAEVEQIYGAKILHYQYAEPIDNTFKVFGIFEE